MKNDFDVSIFLITDDNQYIPLEDYDNIKDDNLAFICLTNDMLNSDFDDDNTICISRYTDMYLTGQQIDQRVNMLTNKHGEVMVEYSDGYVKYIWQADTNQINGMKYINVGIDNTGYYSNQLINDFNGYDNTQIILSQQQIMLEKHNRLEIDYHYGILETVDDMFPAISCAYKSIHKFQGNELHGYVPAIGQLQYISHYAIIINDILSRFGIHTIPPKIFNHRDCLENVWWSSSQKSRRVVWVLDDGKIDAFGSFYEHAYTLPLFKIN